MGKLADALKKLTENPDDLTSLPDLITKVTGLEDSEVALLDRVDKLHEANKRYLQMVTVNEPKKEEPKEEEKIPTLEELAKMMTNKGVD